MFQLGQHQDFFSADAVLADSGLIILTEVLTTGRNSKNQSVKRERELLMKRSNSIAAAAALAGLLSGTATRLNAKPHNVTTFAQDAQAPAAAKHSCAGKNSCKGTGGCATDGSLKNMAKKAKVAEKHACAGKNSCKGKGGCATDGSVKNKAMPA